MRGGIKYVGIAWLVAEKSVSSVLAALERIK